MGRTRLPSGQISDAAIEDSDGDTKVDCEESSGENKIRFDTAGSERMIIDENGKIGIGTGSPSTSLYVYSDVSNNYVATIDNDQGSSGHGLKITSDGSGTGTYLLDIESGTTTLFRFRGDGRLGIGTTTPGQTLTVEGDIGVGTNIVHKGDADTYIAFDADQINFHCGNWSFLKLDKDSPNKVVMNNGGNNIDLQVKGANQANLIRTDATNDMIGIHTSLPGSGLDVRHSISLPATAPKTSDYSIAATDFCVIGDCNSAAITLTLPSATDAMLGRIYTIKRIDSGNNGGGNQLTVSRNNKNIDGAAGDLILANLDAVVLQCVGATNGWIRIGQFLAPI